MFERFTDRARRVVVLAQAEASRLNHNYIGTEHILLGLIREGEGVAAQVLRELGADLDRVRQTVIQFLSGYTAGEGVQDPVQPWLPARGPTCQRCSLPLARTLAYRTLVVPAADEEGETVSLRTLFCTGCGGLVHTSLA